MDNRLRTIGLGALLFGAGTLHAATATYGPLPYLQQADSPLAGLAASGFVVETFEDGTLPDGVAATSGGSIVSSSALTDSVDEDDGAIDGSGVGGRSFFSLQQTRTLTFEFDAAVLGELPTLAGIVWTDVGFVDAPGSTGFGAVSVSAYDAGGAIIATIGPSELGDGAVAGQTAEDRFFGFRHDAGIASLAVSMPASDDFEVDHLQFGRVVPIPPAVVLFAAALLALLVGKRRTAGPMAVALQ